jgi:SAM-dependent methyltransferase
MRPVAVSLELATSGADLSGPAASKMGTGMGGKRTLDLGTDQPARQGGRLPAYSENARSYERDTAAFQRYREAVVEALPLRLGQVVLDVGSGTGLCCGMLRDKVGPQGRVVGIEESPQMAAVAREHIASEGWDNVTVVEAPAEDAEIAVTADAALFCAVHDILQSPDALRNVMSSLRPKARVAAGGGKWATPLCGREHHRHVAPCAVRADLRRVRQAVGSPGAAGRGRPRPGDRVRRRVHHDRHGAAVGERMTRRVRAARGG